MFLCTFQYSSDYVHVSFANGLIRVYQLRDVQLHLVFVSESAKMEGGEQLLCRHIRSLAMTPQAIYYGDDGLNVKVLKWREGTVVR